MPLVKRKNSKYWYVQFQINHRTVIRSSKTTDRKAAKQLEDRLRAEVHAELLIGKKKPITIHQALARYVRSKAGTPNHKNLESQRRALLSVFSGSRRLHDLSAHDLEQFVTVRRLQGRSGQTIKHGLNCLFAAIDLAKGSGHLVPELVSPSVKIPRHRTRYLTVEEERRLLAELDPKREGKGLAPYQERSARVKREMQDCYDLVVVLLDTGARYSEIANILWEQIDLKTRQIRLWRSKVGNEGLIFMTERVHSILSRRASHRPFKTVFFNRAGGARGYAGTAIRKALKRAGLHDCTIHTLRHTHASRLIQNGLSVYEVKAVLGHSDIRTTMRYAHLEEAVVTSRARDVIERVSS